MRTLVLVFRRGARAPNTGGNGTLLPYHIEGFLAAPFCGEPSAKLQFEADRLPARVVQVEDQRQIGLRRHARSCSTVRGAAGGTARGQVVDRREPLAHDRLPGGVEQRDLEVGADAIQLENAIFAKLVTAGQLSTGNYRQNLSGTAMDGNDFILYETDTGKLYYDADGSGTGAATQLATVYSSGTTPATLSAADFMVT